MTKPEKYLLCLLLLAGVQYTALAQRGGMMPFRNAPFRAERQELKRTQGTDRLSAIKNAYINKRLNLTPEEASNFWPLYNQYRTELNAMLRQRRQNNSSQQANGIDQVNRDMFYEQRILAIRNHYKDEFLKILPADKVSTLYKSEREFKDELIKQLMERAPADDQ